MRYLLLLNLIQGLFGANRFKTRQLFDLLTGPDLCDLAFATNGSNHRSLRSRLASMSADLNRLYCMQFLKRRRRRRTSVLAIRGGKSWPLGYEYVYQISMQGMKYLHYKNVKSRLPPDAYVASEMMEEERADKEVRDAHAILISLGLKP